VNYTNKQSNLGKREEEQQAEEKEEEPTARSAHNDRHKGHCTLIRKRERAEVREQEETKCKHFHLISSTRRKRRSKIAYQRL
jgi:hypothetical protein